MTDIDVSHYNTGTATIANNGVNVVGQGTTWLTIRKGDMFGTHVGDGVRILEIIDDTHLTLAYPWTGPSQTTAAYEIQRTPYDIGYLQRLEELIVLLNSGNLESLAGLNGIADNIPIFTGPGTMGLITKGDLVSGIQVNAKVENMAGRATYDNEPAGFLVYVADVGNSFGPLNAGRAAIFYKKTNALADWSVPGYVTGPIGPMPIVQAGTVTTGLPGTNAIVTVDPISGGYEIDFTIPAGAGFYWQNAYNPANAYAKDFVVRHNGSSFIALQAVPAGQAPSTAFPPVDNTYWAVLASKGADGAGDVTAPAGPVTDRRLIVFDGTTGKLITQASGLTAAQQGQARADIDAGVLAGFRNKVINGDGIFNQRGQTSYSAMVYNLDRWRTYVTGTVNVEVAPRSFAPHVVPALGMGGYGIDLNFTGNGVKQFFQPIENAATLAGRIATLTYWVYCPDTGINLYPLLYQECGVGGLGSEAVAPIYADATTNGGWKKCVAVFSVPSIAAKTIGTGSTLNVYPIAVDSNAAIALSLFRVSLVEGDATAGYDPFSPRHIQQELALCQRYFYKCDTPTLLQGNAPFSGFGIQQLFRLPQIMRTIPSISKTLGGGSGVAVETTINVGRDQWQWQIQSNVTENFYYTLDGYTADAEL